MEQTISGNNRHMGWSEFESKLLWETAEESQAQGLPLPFTPAADFSGISDKPLLVNMVEQKVRIDVTEKGTEFAAVTVVGMVTSGIGKPVTPPKVTVDVNRPFIYTIREATSGTILLLGTLSN